MTKYWVIVALIFGCISAADFCLLPYECVAIGHCRTRILTGGESRVICFSDEECCLNANAAWSYGYYQLPITKPLPQQTGSKIHFLTETTHIWPQM